MLFLKSSCIQLKEFYLELYFGVKITLKQRCILLSSRNDIDFLTQTLSGVARVANGTSFYRRHHDSTARARLDPPSGSSRGRLLLDPGRSLDILGARPGSLRGAFARRRLVTQRRKLDVALGLGVLPSVLPRLFTG